MDLLSTKEVGVPEIIKNENGILVNSTSEDFASAIIELNQNHIMLSKIKISNLKHIKEKFTLLSSTEKYLELFSNIIAQRTVS